MRTVILVAASILALTACNRQGGGKPSAAASPVSPAAAPLATSQPPARRAGLWEQTMNRDGAAPMVMGKMRLCVDAASEAKISLFGGRMGKGRCGRRSVSRQLNGNYDFTSTCDMGEAGVTTSKGTLSGDLSSRYRVHAESDIAGSSIPSLNGHHVTDIEATWLGACPAGMTPGDIVMGNGMKINVDKISAAAAAAGGGA
jgi:hypothetical protein